ncbi:MAG: dUTP diphosphatase [Patescibacteria group bacterium]
MKAKVKRFDKSLPLPEYKTDGAAAMDCYARENASIPAGQVILIPLNLAVQPPAGHFVLLAARSSLHKKGLSLANGIAIGDEDFSGDKDEYRAALYNFSNQAAEIKKGDRIVQMMIFPYTKVEWEEVEKLNEKNRGGFGSTGV